MSTQDPNGNFNSRKNQKNPSNQRNQRSKKEPKLTKRNQKEPKEPKPSKKKKQRESHNFLEGIVLICCKQIGNSSNSMIKTHTHTIFKS
ncbi:hypothetical protein M0813_07492 [Anaeramoeba flamelloides]|uniref:Uncharacterized protein n=1 Tax=Anaeramoeba flamelloides TaxID=1746091 RepID=A0ABQ8XB52_9EUKA|nr:hypothetical protein M0813_07492 [Anaeramoeba flamelloides]